MPKLKTFLAALKRIKTGRRSSSEKQEKNILRIVSEGPHLAEYDVTGAVQAWHFSKARRFNQKTQKRQEHQPSQRFLQILIPKIPVMTLFHQTILTLGTLHTLFKETAFLVMKIKLTINTIVVMAIHV